MSSTRSAAISALAFAIVRPSSSTSANSEACRAARSAVTAVPSSMSEHFLDFPAQGLGVERLDDVIRDAGLLGRDDVLCLALGRHHDERRGLELRIRTNLLQQLQAGHR